MGYPYGDTYLEQIQKNRKECEQIENAYYLLRRKYLRENNREDCEITIKEHFAILGEAFELASSTLDGIMDTHHFMWDILDELFAKKIKEDNDNSFNNSNEENKGNA